MPGAADTSLGAIGQIAVRVRDMERAVTFYRDVLRIPFLFSAGPRLAFFDAGGTRLMLDIPEPGFEQAGTSVLYFRVGDIHAARQALLGRGTTFRDEPHLVAKMPDHELWMTFFDDSEGNLLALMSELSPPPA